MKTMFLISRLLPCCLFWLWIFLGILNHPALGNEVNDEITDDEVVCTQQRTCGACISASLKCSWCKNVVESLLYSDKQGIPEEDRRIHRPKRCASKYRNKDEDKIQKVTDGLQNLDFDKIRCDTEDILIQSGCPVVDIVNPKTELHLLKDEPTSHGLNAVQMKPQKVRLRLRSHESAEIPFEFYLVQDYAVDMYFLMDLSNTMKVHIERLAQVSIQLVDDIRNLTKSLQVGIGSFVDKNILPYSLTELCINKECKEKYDFKQMIKLTDEFSQFQTTVDMLKNMTTENLDTPEAGLDAVLQSIVCEDIIGWRKESRRLIIYSSDAPFHYGGDGKLGGIMIPNDGQCHLKSNSYVEGKNQDYPSVGQIAHTIQENQITVIFAVSPSRLKIYQNFVKNIRGAYVSELNTQTSTIAEIVKERYKNISSRVEMSAVNKDVDIKFMSQCSGSKWMNTNYCDNLKPPQNVKFKALIPPQKCPPGKQKVMKNIEILPIGMKQKIEIELEVICGCDCEKSTIAMSPYCHRIGNLTCGKCFCDKKCLLYNTTTECSDRGSCECGKCHCDKIPNSKNRYYSGEHCQCNDYSCPNFNRTICGGPSHGKCVCDKCICNEEFTGENCGCPKDSSTCIAKNNKTCNDHGKCVCGVCECDIHSGYKGKTCDDCPTCGQCAKFKDCVKCFIGQKTKDTKKCSEPCHDVAVEIVEKLENNEQSNDDRDLCTIKINDCFVQYKNGIEKIAILKKQDCAKKINLIPLICGIIGGILIAGLIILGLWKGITTYQDRRELARFNRDRDNAKWTAQSNPLYVNASTTFKNPMWASNPDL